MLTLRPSGPIWALGFRPFFTLAAGAAAILIAQWAAVLAGWLEPPRYYGSPSEWHAHEMLFGFATAAALGFLLTASQNWTGRRGVNGRKLQALAALWLAGRVLPWLAPVGSVPFAVVDMAFVPVAAIVLAGFLKQEGQARNRGFLALLGLIAAANLLVHLQALGLPGGAARRGLLLALDAVLVMTTLVSGRVVPLFTRKALPALAVRNHPLLDGAALATAGAFLVADAVSEGSAATGAVAVAAGLVSGARLLLWNPLGARKTPMLLVLYAGSAWMACGFLLRGAAYFWPVPRALGIHAHAVGAVGVMILGMMARVSLGHTGRAIRAGPAIGAGFILVNLAAVLRVVVAGLAPEIYLAAVYGAAAAWTLAFGLFVMNMAPFLTKPRVDGREG